MKRVIAYIDGFNLYFDLRAKGWRRYYWLNLERLAENLMKPGQELGAVKYFTARISANPHNPGKQKRQALYLEAVESLPKTIVFYGHYLPKQQRCFRCGASWATHEEKMTDVNMSVELMKDAFDNSFDVALLLSADSDLTAPVEFIRQRFMRKRIVMICPPERQSKKLETLVHAAFRLDRKKLQDSRFPDTYAKPDGFEVKRPERWR